ncbi:MAG: hypothetical protein XU08_C0003G0119 [candidate division WWE3 bacterium CSP1-7]|uniref:Uncharacterized protein n=1 Tax=candidate division WWE3 bacterium CSP1-7 TaxID=1576480 RepID=A0A0T5ZXB1_UNCKA|nr:MAG: hypothetical protein XU08_C0003G0119 [candidate division WWE3 bacterium CSP1-7]
MAKFSLAAARKFQRRFQKKGQKILGHLGIWWVPRRDYDRLDRWFADALDHIEKLNKESRR